MHQATGLSEDAPYGLQLSGLDPGGLTAALAQAALAAARRPDVLAKEALGLALAQAEAAIDVMRGTTQEETGDPRFTDRAWRENPFLRLTLAGYLAGAGSARRLVASADVPEQTRRKARFLLDLLLDAVAPSNVPWLNPTVTKEAVDTGGMSLVRGLANAVRDVATNGALPRSVDRSGFELGRNLAATPGRVVLRNDLIELLAYEPQTETVFAEPLLYSPPWINKYYVLDLAPGRSFVEHAVQSGFTVFAISYRNPDASMAVVTLDDYLRDGLLAAVERASELAGSPRVNLLGVCLGGTLATIALAVLAARGEAERIGSAALVNALVDFSDPGEIGAFTDEAAIERIERRMARRGYLAPSELAGPFMLMRANDLVWRYVVSSWYMGKRPPAFDILAWNADATRLPTAMHSRYLRACYLGNELVRPGTFVIDGTPVDVSRIETPLYVLGAESDHIAPWRATYRTTQLVGGEARYVLASSGHIASMVSSPGNPKSWFERRDDSPPTADGWRGGTERVQGSWWGDWAAWAAARSGERVAPPTLPPGEPAPGSYVRG